MGANAATSANHRLAKAGGRSCCPRPAIAEQQLPQVGSIRGWRHQHALISLISETFILSVQFECLPPTGQRSGEDLLSGERLERKAAVGLAKRKIVTKLNERKHTTAGSIVARSRIWETHPQGSLELHGPQLY